MKKLIFLLILLLVFAFGCSNEDVFNPDAIKTADLKSSHGKVIHTAVLGTNDACEALGLPNGCDGNFSLVANLYEDGTASGEWQDTFSGGEGIHVKIDCAHFGETNGIKWAILAGEVTKDKGDYPSDRAVTLIADNIDGNGLDLMSASFPSIGTDCNILQPSNFPQVYYLPVTAGQVIIR